MITKEKLLSYLLDYLSLKVKDFKFRNNVKRVFSCPLCKEISANIIPNTYIIFCLACNKKIGDIFDIVKLIEIDKKDYTNEQIINYLIKLLELKETSEIDIDKLLEFYEKNGWDLVPVAKNQKIPVELEWTKRIHKDKKEWKEWLNNNLNLGLKCGECSNISVVDIDTLIIDEELKIILDKIKTLTQKTTKGMHYYFKYCKDLPKTRLDSIKVDIENNGGQVVIPPSTVDNLKRELNIEEIIEIPKELKDYLLSKITIPNLKSFSEKIKEDIITENFNLEIVKEGNRNSFLCFSSGTPVRTPAGKKEIQLLKKGDEVFSYDFETKDIKKSTIVNTIKIKSDRKILLTIEPYKRWGITKIDCTPEQLFYTNRGWIESQNLEVGDEIFTINNKTNNLLNENFNFIGLLGYKIGYIYGYIKGDGCIRKDNMIDIVSKDIDGLSRIKNYLQQIFTVNLNINKNHKKYFNLILFSHLTVKLLTKVKNFENKGSIEFKRGFLAGIFDAEGYNGIFTLSIHNTNYNLIEKIKSYLCDLQFETKIEKDDRKNKFICYSVNISKLENIVKFFYLMRPAILRKYPWSYFSKYGIKNGRKVISKKIKIGKNRKFIFYDFETVPFHNFFASGLLVHNCHLGGVLRKEMNISQVDYTLNIVNRHFCKPSLQQREVDNIVKSLDKYVSHDSVELAQKVLQYMKIVEEASSRDIREALGETTAEGKQRVEKAIKYLVTEGFLLKIKRVYHLIKRAEWKDTWLNESKAIDFKMPYFDDVATFREGDMLIIGGAPKVGKTHASLNIIKQLVEQNKKPFYVNLESGNRFALISQALGLKEGDFSWCTHFKPENIDIEKNAITIIDWLLPTDYAVMDKLFQHFALQLVKNGGILIVFVQLKQDNTFFAPNMISMFPAFVSRYIYDDENKGDTGKFRIDYIREPKIKQKKFSIPCAYNFETRELKRIDEVYNTTTNNVENDNILKI